ncbi:membrane protein [Staphylococcus phage ESa2]|nr:membrane protein [Staphylococcus phage ESa2]
MKYDINEKRYDEKDFILQIIYESYSDETDREVETIYNKAEAWDKLCEMLKDKDMSDEYFEEEMFKLFSRTGKSFTIDKEGSQ